MPPWLYPIAEVNSHLAVVGVAIKLVERINQQLHCGVVYRQAGTPSACFLHLAFHADLRQDCPPRSTDYLWVVLPIDELRVDAVAAMCDSIWRRGKLKIPYGIRYNGAQFDQDGILYLSSAAHGLTCATFVMAVFQSAGIKLIEWETWPPRTTDAEWHQWIVNELRGFRENYPNKISEDHINNIQGEQGCARFRPEEVTGACSSENLPASFDYAVAAGQEILVELLN